MLADCDVKHENNIFAHVRDNSIPRCVKRRQRHGEMQLVWLWWTRSSTICRVGASPPSSSHRVWSRRPSTARWLKKHILVTTAWHRAQGRGHRHAAECPNRDQNYCFCTGLRWGCMWLKHQHRNLQFVASLLHREDHVGVPGITFSQGQLFFSMAQAFLTSWIMWQNKLCMYYCPKWPNYLHTQNLNYPLSRNNPAEITEIPNHWVVCLT